MRVETSQQEREIQRNAGESTIIAARVELSLAELDLEKYQSGDYPAEITKQKGEIRLREKELEENKTKLEQFKALMKKGFKTKEEIRVMEIGVEGKKQDLSSSTQFLDVKERYERKRKLTEYTSKLDQARKRVDQAVATARAQDARGPTASARHAGHGRDRTAAVARLSQRAGAGGHQGPAGRHPRLCQRRLRTT